MNGLLMNPAFCIACHKYNLQVPAFYILFLFD